MPVSLARESQRAVGSAGNRNGSRSSASRKAS
jgi:hypothetical protein